MNVLIRHMYKWNNALIAAQFKDNRKFNVEWTNVLKDETDEKLDSPQESKERRTKDDKIEEN